MPDHLPHDDAELRAAITNHLGRSVLGMSTPDIARSVRRDALLVSTTLRAMQQDGLVAFRRQRWRLTQEPAPRIGPPIGPARTTPAAVVGELSASSQDERRIQNSRWATFRRLCQYYAECVRLDQGTTIHGKDVDENQKFVCISGNLGWPDSSQRPEFSMPIPTAWSEFVQAAKRASHLFLGAPLNRFKWRDSSSGENVVFVSPVFLAPVEFEIDQMQLHLRLLGPIRINDGWLEKRLSNVDDRRVFLELCGQDLDTSDRAGDEPFYRSFRPFCDLLAHFYPTWCMERLDVRWLTTGSAVQQLQQDGIYNRAALFLPGKWRYTERLHRELLDLAWNIRDEDLDRSALRHVFPHKSPRRTKEPVHSIEGRNSTSNSDSPIPLDARGDSPDLRESLEPLVHLASVESLNEEQIAACQAGAAVDLSVVVGPPGTGKSRVVQAVLAQAAVAGRSALFASRNHQALEAVVPRLNALVEPAQVILRLARPFGQGGDVGLQQALADLVSRPSREDAVARRDEARHRLLVSLERLNQVRAELHRYQRLQMALTDVERRLADRQACLPTGAADLLPRALGLTNAAEVTDLIAMLGPAPRFRFSFRWLVIMVRRWLRNRPALTRAIELDAALKKVFAECHPMSPAELTDTRDRRTVVANLQRWLPFAQASDALRLVQQARSELEAVGNPELIYDRFQTALNHVVTVSRECLQSAADAWGAELSPDERRRLIDLWAGVQSHSADAVGVEQQQLDRLMNRAFPLLVQHVPLLATTNLSAGRHLPLKAGLVDLLIIDEASQCDIASVIPLLFRCRRAMFVGDPMQLSHVTRISGALDTQLRRQFQLLDTELVRFSYRAASAFHLAVAAEQLPERLQLRQHHRCHPRIAGYCNAAFYRETLVVMTDEVDRGGGACGLQWTHIPGDVEGVAGGGAVSRAQQRAIVDELKRLAREQFPGTVGVVTPFRQQANRIRDAICQEIDQAVRDRWRLLVDTADGFQGDERHIVLFSLVGGSVMPTGSLRFLTQTPNRFNVAVSRAMRLLHVFGDLDWAKQCEAVHIRRLASACGDQPVAMTGFRADLIGPVWEPKLAEALRAAGLPFEQQYPACGRYLDFALIKPGLKLNVEVDGEAFHRGPDGGLRRDDLDRDLVLIANGWSVMRFWVYQLRGDMTSCEETSASNV
jgi:very-short-patch-repair endonuclease